MLCHLPGGRATYRLGDDIMAGNRKRNARFLRNLTVAASSRILVNYYILKDVVSTLIIGLRPSVGAVPG